MNNLSKAYLFSRLLGTPLEAMYTLLIFILVKEFNPSWLQLSLLAASKPISSLFAFYLSAGMIGRQHQFKRYLVAVSTLTAMPALIFPLIESCWFYIAAHFIFMIGQRASFPVWNSTLKNHLMENRLSSLQAKAISIQQSIAIFAPMLIGYWIDFDREIWKSLFLGLAVVQMSSSLMMQFLLPAFNSPNNSATSSQVSFLSPTAQWQESKKLLLARRDFFSYLQLFFWGGTGLVMMQSTLPQFFNANLHLSYTSIALASSVCKGIALIATTPLWAYWVNKMSLYRFNLYINLFSTLFIAFILLSNIHSEWVFAAYLFYGAMQAGCELSWNMSGPHFAKEKECTLYSSLNLPLIGLRGMVFPFVGQWILLLSNANVVFLCAAALTLASLLYARKLDCAKYDGCAPYI